MKIIVTKEEVQEVRAIVDVLLKSAGVQALQIANKMLSSIEVEKPVKIAQEGIEPEKTK